MARVEGRIKLTLTRPSGQVLDLGVASDVGALWLLSRWHDFGAPQNKKMLRGFRAAIDGSKWSVPYLKLVVWGKNTLEEDPVLLGTFSLSKADQYVKMRLAAKKFFQFKLEDEGVQGRFKLTRLQVFGSVTSGRVLE